MIIDFRIRPPYRSFLSLSMYLNSADTQPESSETIQTSSPLAIHRGPIPSAEHQSIDLLLAEMKDAGIQQAVVMGRQAAARYGYVLNDDIARLQREHPGYFHAFGGISLNDIPQAVTEVERLLGDMGFKGVAIDSGWSDPPLYADDPVLFPLYETCQRLRGIVSLSMSIFLGPDLTYVEPVRLQHVAAAFPDLQIVVPHAGWPYVLEYLGIAYMYRNVWLAPDFYVYVPGMPGAKEFVDAANFYLEDRFLFASSYPERPLKQTVEEFCRLPFRDVVLKKALSENAERLLRV